MNEFQSRVPGAIPFYVVLLASSCVLLWEAWRIEGFGALSGPGTFPMIAAAVMVLCILSLLVRAFARPRGTEEKPPLTERFPKIVTLPMIGYVLLCAAYVLALEIAGFWIASAVFLCVSFAVLHQKGLLKAAIATAASLVFVYIVFRFIFQIYLP
ncbi:tripartite tricarboxylate transporter TctB family protein [Chelativorans sp.]|uniref:tripartite tricarboxylate transporter TctB family protein n=1 Tax=Chelativorans sp. TaxID=2203393 RepID=UPI002811D69D|nr:tripartite tricarboxylate transporter TctB family protein [Chelativorans sp.]